MITFTDQKDKQEFDEVTKQVRSEYIRALNKISWNSELISKSDSVILLFDQMKETLLQK